MIARVEMGLTYAELAAATGKPSAGAARMAVSRALLRLVEDLGGEHAGEALESRRAYEALPKLDQDSLIEFLKTLQVLPPSTKDRIVDEKFQPRPWPPEPVDRHITQPNGSTVGPAEAGRYEPGRAEAGHYRAGQK